MNRLQVVFGMSAKVLGMVGLLWVSLNAVAVGVQAPTAGAILQEIQPGQVPQAPSSNSTGLKAEPEQKMVMPRIQPFKVLQIRIIGSHVFPAAVLHTLVQGAEGKTLTLRQLQQWADKITELYHAQGYFLSRALIPAQRIDKGTVVFQVLEAKYGNIVLQNHSRARFGALLPILAPLHNGSDITQLPLNRSLLLLSDVPGLTVDTTLKPGNKFGTSDLVVVTEPQPLVNGQLGLDNYGNSYTGRIRGSGTVNFLNPLHQGDILSLSGMSSGADMNFGRISYDALANGTGGRVGGSFSALHYILSGALAHLDGNGTAQTTSAWYKQTVERTQDNNVYAQVQYDHQNLQDNLNNNVIEDRRHLDNWTGTLNGDWRDDRWQNATNTWSFSVAGGQVAFDNTAAANSDMGTARTQGGFVRINFNYSRLQALSSRDSLYVLLSAQMADKNLDVSEQMVAGGVYSVRAYDMGVITGDQGVLGTLEWRHDLGHYLVGSWQSVVFVDEETLGINHTMWPAAQNVGNSATLSGVGAGLNWMLRNWTGRMYVATPVGAEPAQISHPSSARAWIEIARIF